MTPLNSAPDFDEIIDRVGTHSAKWDEMERLYGVAPGDGIAMWVADMDFRPPACVQAALEGMCAHGVYGYFGDEAAYRAAIVWWMATRHGWAVAPEWIFTTHGLVNAAALCVETFTEPGEAVVLTTPVYHAFARVIRAAGREVRECPLRREAGRYVLDPAQWAAQLTGRERMLILCSPHNPGGTLWTEAELRAVAQFCERHGLVLVCDEIHHDLVMPGHRHRPFPCVCPEAPAILLTATTKTFNLAGTHTGNVIIADPALRARFAQRLGALGISGNSFGLVAATAAYSPEGAAWVDALCAYLEGNRQLFAQALAALPGVVPMPMEATYLQWVDFSGTGMDGAELRRRVEGEARIAANHGESFGLGGAGHLRFNLATPRARVAEAAARLQQAFADLQ